jgi:hypothetical protein
MAGIGRPWCLRGRVRGGGGGGGDRAVGDGGEGSVPECVQRLADVRHLARQSVVRIDLDSGRREQIEEERILAEQIQRAVLPLPQFHLKHRGEFVGLAP